MATSELSKVDSEVLHYELLPQIEKSFGFTFEKSDLEHVSSFGEFCNVVQTKIQGVESHSCTSQQAFYKLRRALARHQLMNPTPTTLLKDLLPQSQRQRRHILDAVEAELGFELHILGVSNVVGTGIFLAFLLSLAAFLVSWKFILTGLLLTFTSGYIAGKFGNTLEVRTVREVAEKMTRENYMSARRKSDTFNRTEITVQIRRLFQHEFDLKAADLTPESRF